MAEVGREFAGYVTIKWASDYPPFRDEGIPEVSDLNVVPRYRRHGIGTRLMDEAERLMAEGSQVAGIGVGMPVDYGPAQRMYAMRGYVPDGRGLMWHGEPVADRSQATIDDDLVIYMTKRLD